MKNKDVEAMIEQLRKIILNKPTTPLKVQDSELQDLQEGIDYLAQCINEGNEYLKDLSRGNLEVEMPARHNFLVGNMKELHSGLRHLTWQAQQVANGDYNQRVNFFGDFSKSFNTMVDQLKEREQKLKNQTEAAQKSMDFMVSIMNSMVDMILVISKENDKILFTNDAASSFLEAKYFDEEDKKRFIDKLLSYDLNEESNDVDMDITIGNSDYVYNVKPFSVQWDGNIANAYILTDITFENAEKEHLESLAFKDELTGLYNRRFCMSMIEELIIEKADFVICMIDLDGLKYVNDKFGHNSGDEYIRTVSSTITGMVRQNDITARIGGDEFLVIFSKCPPEKAVEKLDKIQKILTETERPYPMSMSYGVVHVDSENTKKVDVLLHEADELMYVQKRKRKKERNN